MSLSLVRSQYDGRTDERGVVDGLKCGLLEVSLGMFDGGGEAAPKPFWAVTQVLISCTISMQLGSV